MKSGSTIYEASENCMFQLLGFSCHQAPFILNQTVANGIHCHPTPFSHHSLSACQDIEFGLALKSSMFHVFAPDFEFIKTGININIISLMYAYCSCSFHFLRFIFLHSSEQVTNNWSKCIYFTRFSLFY